MSKAGLSDFAGKKVLLTGATGGIGQAIALLLAEQGAQLLLVGRKSAELQALALKLQGQQQFFAADLTLAADLQALVAWVQAQGGVDILINNAGSSQFALTEQQQFRSQLELNLLAPMVLCQSLLPQLKNRSAAMIVNIGSAFGSIGYPGFSGYCASKFGLRGFTEALKREVANSRLQVLYFAPRATKTAINSAAVVAMNAQLGTAMDDPTWVAQQLMQQMRSGQSRRYLGFPERIFVRLNALFPALVDNALRAKLAVIEKFANLDLVAKPSTTPAMAGTEPMLAELATQQATTQSTITQQTTTQQTTSQLTNMSPDPSNPHLSSIPRSI